MADIVQVDTEAPPDVTVVEEILEPAKAARLPLTIKKRQPSQAKIAQLQSLVTMFDLKYTGPDAKLLFTDDAS